MERVQRLVDRAVDSLALLAGVLMAVLTVVVTVGIVSRYFFELPIRSTSERSGLLFAWLVFLAAISVTHHQDNIAVTYFRGRLPASLQRVSSVAVKVLMLVFACFMTYSSIILAMAVADQKMPVLQISTAWLNGSVAVAFAGITLVLFLQIVLELFFPHLAKKDAQEESLADQQDRVGGIE
ncbi:TRAP transporter small permease [Ornithinicoccus halotolerans]|uniref:TRAP transporter small permease n=1 Tax=Ornithinicoccus halotolerans TaxID=1748220 RepID=UPI00129620DD|nr:TRAP transporter small permease [Ornithinicoccus halotolerans]